MQGICALISMLWNAMALALAVIYLPPDASCQMCVFGRSTFLLSSYGLVLHYGKIGERVVAASYRISTSQHFLDTHETTGSARGRGVFAAFGLLKLLVSRSGYE